MQTKKVQVIMLPTKDKKFLIWKGKDMQQLYERNALENPEDYDSSVLSQHIYFVDDSHIKEGDWIINGNTGKENHAIICMKDKKDADVMNEISEIMEQQKLKTDKLKNIMTKKILATTNSECNLPLIPQSFIKYYAERNGNVGDIELAMYEDSRAGWYEKSMETIVGKQYSNEPEKDLLKLNPNNEVMVLYVTEGIIPLKQTLEYQKALAIIEKSKVKETVKEAAIKYCPVKKDWYSHTNDMKIRNAFRAGAEWYRDNH